MNLIVTSDFPETRHPGVVEALRRTSPSPRVAWIPSHSEGSGDAFTAARATFTGFGITELELVDIEVDRDEIQIAYLHEYDVIYLVGDDAVRFRFNANRSGLSGRLRQCVLAGRLVVAAGAGGPLLTPNVSVMRLEHESIEDVLATRGRFEGLGVVPYEVVPHRDRWPRSFMTAVQEYSRHVDHDVIAVADGAALIHMGGAAPLTDGSFTRYRKGQIIES